MSKTINKAKKIIISVIAMIVGILGFTTISSAYYVGQTIYVSYNQYATNQDIY